MVSDPVRAVPLSAATAKVTVPLPEPVAEDEIASQVSFAAAVHVHPEPLVTLMVEFPPPAPKVADVGVTVYVHATAGVTFRKMVGV
jgi:hypothetical protein